MRRITDEQFTALLSASAAGRRRSMPPDLGNEFTAAVMSDVRTKSRAREDGPDYLAWILPRFALTCALAAGLSCLVFFPGVQVLRDSGDPLDQLSVGLESVFSQDAGGLL